MLKIKRFNEYEHKRETVDEYERTDREQALKDLREYQASKTGLYKLV